jgi:hypothetical protein
MLAGSRFPAVHRSVASRRVNGPGPGIPDEGETGSRTLGTRSDVDDGDTLRDLVRGAHEALAELGHARVACPADVDRFDWSADLLDELARIALQVAEAAATLAGEHDADVDARARDLATAIVRRRNDALIPLRMAAGRVALRS